MATGTVLQRRPSRGTPAEVAGFLSAGLLVNVATAFGVPHAAGPDLPRSMADWAENLRGVESLGDHPGGPDG